MDDEICTMGWHLDIYKEGQTEAKLLFVFPFVRLFTRYRMSAGLLYMTISAWNCCLIQGCLGIGHARNLSS
jgi:hypothetical protein